MCGREQEDRLIQLANREGAWPKKPYECFLVEGGRLQKEPGMITCV